MKKQRNVKEPVRVRFKELRGGSMSVYLDQYVNGCRKYDFLRMYLVPETDAASRERNRLTMQRVNAIKAQRILELTNEQAGISNCVLHSKMLLADYLRLHLDDSKRTHRGDSYAANCRNMGKHLFEFLGNRRATLHMKDIDAAMCRQFAYYLRSVTKPNGQPLSAVSVHHYFGAFRSLLVAAVADEVIAMNPIDKLRKNEIPERPVVIRDYLDAKEVATLASTPCRNSEVRRAFLFSCFTGLRISDVQALRWGNIRQSEGGLRLQIVMQKTQEPISCKLSKAAIDCLKPLAGLEDSSQKDERVFRLPVVSSIERIIARWTEDAGIKKRVTFHTARHSYATMALTAGTDLYTISRLLGHRNVNTTSLYAAVVDEKRDAAVDSVAHLFQTHFSKQARK